MSNHPNRPANVTIAAVFVLSITSWNLLRAYAAIINWSVLSEFLANPAYILGTALLWTLTGIWLLSIIRKRFRYSIRANLIAAGLYFCWFWCDRLFIQPAPAQNVSFSAVVSTLLLVIFCIILSTPASRAFLNKE
jgi:hypothetical protein